MPSIRPTLIVIAGPTASGKTDLALKVADFYKTEILSADSRQCYCEMNIGTAKPSREELDRIRHHFINSHSITTPFTAGQFADQARLLLKELFQIHRAVVVVGGTGLYLKALLHGLDEIPDIDPSVRDEINTLYQKLGLSAIQEIVRHKDPDFYSQMDVNNPARMIRAAEIITGTGNPYSWYLKKKTQEPDFNIKAIVTNWSREELYHRINTRVDEMIHSGLLKEVESLYAYRNLTALKTVGYQELFDYLDHKYSLEEAIQKIKQHTRNYAKRQLTWFRHQGSYVFLEKNKAFEYLTYSDSLK